jgi:capsular polysaccharide biosynthesis protein
MRRIFAPPSIDDLIRVLRAWRFWLLSAVVGAVAGAAAFYAFPPPFRARATVLVDFHLEQAWPQNTDREQFYYLERETRKLEEIARSDAVLEAIVHQIPGVSFEDMRAGKLQLSQPGNGGWHFYAEDADASRAVGLASAWARAFADRVQAQVDAGPAGGLESYITVQPVQVQGLLAQRVPDVSVYLLGGAVLAAVIGALGVLFIYREP